MSDLPLIVSRFELKGEGDKMVGDDIAEEEAILEMYKQALGMG